jgi:hypothetical protein
MTTTYTTRNRFAKQGTGDNASTWGAVLNSQVFDLVDKALGGRTAITVSGTVTLGTADGADSQALCMFLDVTGGSGGTVIIPNRENVYLVRNGSSGAVVVSTGGGASFAVSAGSVVFTATDGVNVRGFDAAAADAAILAAAQAYTDSATFQSLPSMTGKANTLLGTNGAIASWQSVSAVLSGLGIGACGLLDGIDNAHLASVANTLKGDNGSGAADLTGAQATALLSTFAASGASHAKGLVPDPGGSAGATRFLREDAAWAAPAAPDLAALDSSTKLAAVTGYVDLGPVILQWGLLSFANLSGTNLTAKAVSFPLAFPNAAYNISGTPALVTGSSSRTEVSLTVSAGSLSTTGATFELFVGGSEVVNGVYWFAVGS